MAVFEEQHPFQDWMQQLIAEKNPSEPGRTWGLERGRVDCETGFSEMATDPEFQSGWAFWLWLNDWGSLSPALHDRLLDVIAAQGPRVCSIAWYRLQNLTLAQQRRLRSIFYGRDRVDQRTLLPAIEKQIRSREIAPVSPDEDIDRTERASRVV